jgi:polysaccharide export outer membrane protein
LRIADCGLRIGSLKHLARPGLPFQFRNPKSAILNLFVLLFISACASSPPRSQDPPPAIVGVRPGDVIRVWVWRETDYSGEFPVDARGIVVLPNLGPVGARGKTAQALSDSITRAYQKFLNNPSIQITVLRRVAVSGEVAKPGLYPADATISVGELIALAGGVTPSGNKSKIELVRDGRVITSALGPGTVLQNSPVQSGDQVFVPQRGWFSRNGGIFLTAGVSVTTAVIVALLIRR